MSVSESQFEAPGPEITPEVFREWRSPRFGTSNPERLDNPVWEWLIRSQHSAYSATQRFEHSPADRGDPGWSFARFGQSSTELPGGRTILIAGEHEDSYDPDFYIYNDVVVRHPNGSLDIFGYPREVFPPTDFHSATLAGDRIVVVGSLGYPADRRPGNTQVAVLDLATFAISLIETGGDAPGWIHSHSATLTENGAAIVVSGGKIETGRGRGLDFVDNGDDWRLDLATWRWTRLTDRQWKQWQLTRADRGPNQLFQLRSLWQFRGIRWAKEHRESMEAMIRSQTEKVTAAYGAEPDLDLFGALFSPPIAHRKLPDVETELGVHRLEVDGVVVRYVEHMLAIKIVIEGVLPEATRDVLVSDLRAKLSTLEHVDYVVTEL